MAVFSKHTLPYSCYEVGHTWSPHCTHSAVGVGSSCFQEGLKIYTSVYLLSLILGGKIPDANGWKKLLLGIVQSSIFLGCNGFTFLSSFCVCRKILGQFGLFSAALLPSFIANYLSILVERPSRRPALAIYVTNVASETLYRMLVARGVVKPIPHGQVVIFALTLAALFRWYRSTRDSRNFQYKILKALVGEQEIKSASFGASSTAPTQSVTGNRPNWMTMKHRRCPHKDGCLKFSFQVLVQRFLYGWGIHTCLSLVLSVPMLVRKPSRLFSLLKQGKHVRFGAFLASLATIYRAVHCILRWVRGRDDKNHSILAGLLAGTSIRFYPNSTVVLYLMWKTLETLYYEGIEAGLLPNIPGFPAILYSLSTSILFHAAVLEPHNLKPAYWRFLNRITHNKISEMNRCVLEHFGTQSGKLMPDFRPKYNMDKVSDQFKTWLSFHK